MFSTAYLPYIGGAEVAIQEITKRLPAMRFLILTARMSRRLPRQEERGNVTVARLGFGTRFDKWFLPLFAFMEALRHTPVLLWGMMVSQGTVAGYFVKKIHPRIPFIVTLQEGDADAHLRRGRAGLIRFFWKRVCAAADGITAISEHLAQHAKEAGWRGEVAIIPNGVDENYVSRSFERMAAPDLRAELMLPAEARVILSVSRLVPKNGLQEVVGAIPVLLKRGFEPHVVLVGDGPERSALERHAADLDISGYVHFPGAVSHEEALRYYQLADVFVRPSRSEGQGISFLEAMGAGVPVVATPVGGIVDFISDRETGIFVRPGDAEDVARGIADVLESPALCERIVAQARALVIDRYLWVDISKRMEMVFQKFL